VCETTRSCITAGWTAWPAAVGWLFGQGAANYAAERQTVAAIDKKLVPHFMRNLREEDRNSKNLSNHRRVMRGGKDELA
jgi:hypothetical protein